MRIWDRFRKQTKPLTQEEVDDIVENKIIQIVELGTEKEKEFFKDNFMTKEEIIKYSKEDLAKIALTFAEKSIYMFGKENDPEALNQIQLLKKDLEKWIK